MTVDDYDPNDYDEDGRPWPESAAEREVEARLSGDPEDRIA